MKAIFDMTSQDLANLRKEGAFNEWVAALIDFATNDGDMRAGRRSQQTREAAKWLRAAYREALKARAEP